MPETARIKRQALEQIGEESAVPPCLLTVPYFRMGISADCPPGRFTCRARGWSNSTIRQRSPTTCKTMTQDEFYISRFVDYRGEDGLFRKYRIVLIEGRPFICHMAISSHWMIHYLNAGMTESAEKRAEEARFMANFDEEFALRHADAFRAIYERMGLDYLGIDCGETADGSLLIFEVDSNMVVHALDPVDIFPYKQPQMRKVFAAFRQMLINAMKRGS